MTPGSRAILQGIVDELLRIERQAREIGDEFLAFLVASAAGEARDQLRDDALKVGRAPVATHVDAGQGGQQP